MLRKSRVSLIQFCEIRMRQRGRENPPCFCTQQGGFRSSQNHESSYRDFVVNTRCNSRTLTSCNLMFKTCGLPRQDHNFKATNFWLYVLFSRIFIITEKGRIFNKISTNSVYNWSYINQYGKENVAVSVATYITWVHSYLKEKWLSRYMSVGTLQARFKSNARCYSRKTRL